MTLIRNSRAGIPVGGTVTVEVWGEEPIGAAQVDALHARYGADMAGFTGPTPAGWGAAGSFETTDQHVWADPQAFIGPSGVQLSTMGPLGSSLPIEYPTDAHLSGIVIAQGPTNPTGAPVF